MNTRASDEKEGTTDGHAHLGFVPAERELGFASKKLQSERISFTRC